MKLEAFEKLLILTSCTAAALELAGPNSAEALLSHTAAVAAQAVLSLWQALGGISLSCCCSLGCQSHPSP